METWEKLEDEQNSPCIDGCIMSCLSTQNPFACALFSFFFISSLFVTQSESHREWVFLSDTHNSYSQPLPLTCPTLPQPVPPYNPIPIPFPLSLSLGYVMLCMAMSRIRLEFDFSLTPSPITDLIRPQTEIRLELYSKVFVSITLSKEP